MIALLPRLRRFAYALTGSWADADDLVQATCERAIDRLDQWEVGTRLDSWMYRIAQNLHLNRLRHDRTRMTHLRSVDPDESDRVSANSAIDRITLGEVGQMIARLPMEQRAALMLIAVENRDYNEAAEILGVSTGTVGSRVSRARATLVQMMNGGSDV